MQSDIGRDESSWELAAEAISVRIRWFGLIVGWVLVNLIERSTNQPALNAILALGAVYACLDAWQSIRGRIFLARLPLLTSLMEAVFIALLCYFDTGVNSPFRFYYFLSLLLCAIRYSRTVTYTTFVLHSTSYILLIVFSLGPSVRISEAHTLTDLIFMLVLMGWLAWSGTALAEILKQTGHRLSAANDKLRDHQRLLEDRIRERTRELQQSQALLVQQEKQAAFGLLAAGIAHEVGNPLAAISSLVQLLQMRDLDDYTRERLQMVADQLNRIQRTLRELVGFSRPASLERTRCDVHEVINAALSIAKYYKRKKGREIVTQYADDLPRLRAVRDQLVQVFLNVILNALDATQDGGRLNIRTSMDGENIRVDIRDNGHGVPEDDREAIFQPYYTTKNSGTGLGLFVCRHVLQEIGDASIELTQSNAEGTTFTIWLRPEQPSDKPVESTATTGQLTTTK